MDERAGSDRLRHGLSHREQHQRTLRIIGRHPAALTLALLIAIPVSVANLRRTLVVNADLATPMVVSEAVRQHGLAALRAWSYTQDNWLLSVLLPNLLITRLVGCLPWLSVGEGWLTFAVQCLFISLLAREMIGGFCAGLLAAILLCASPAALGQIAALAHPVSHGVTACWGLASVWLLVRAQAQGGLWRIPLAALLLLIASVSDPWAKPAFLLPLILAALLAAVASPTRTRHSRALFCAVAPLAVLIAGSHLFGLLRFLPGSQLEFGSLAAAPARLMVVGRTLATLFPLLPIPPGRASVWIADDALLALLLGAASWLAFRHRQSLPPSQIFLFAWAIFSLIGTVAAYLVSDLPPQPGYGRFFLNAYAALPVLACLLLRSRTLAVLLGAGLIASASLALASPPPPDRDSSAAGLLAFLDRHGLRYGYGGYWSSQANAMRWISRGRVTIRPVSASASGDSIEPRRPQSFFWWYRASDVPAGQKLFFFVASPDLDLCPDRAACVALGARAFGPPIETLAWNRAAIMVWDHPLLGRLPSARAPMAPPASGRSASGRPDLGRPDFGQLDFTSQASLASLYYGWSRPGRRGVTGLEERAVLRLPAGGSRICVNARLAAGRSAAAMPVRVSFGARWAATWMVGPLSRRYCADDATSDAAMVFARVAATDGTPMPGLTLSSLVMDQAPP